MSGQTLLKLSEIVRDEDIYPRQNVSHVTIESYVEALKVGARFPPVEVQRVWIKNGEDFEEKTVCLDGWHRLEAYREYSKLEDVTPIEEVEANYWRDDVLDKETQLVDLMVRSAELNTRHGLRLPKGDMKYHLTKIAETPDALNLSWKDIAEKFGVTPQWASECVSGILTRRRMSRDAFMLKLSLLGWTQEEIGELVGINQGTVSYFIDKLNELNSSIISGFFEKGKALSEIAEYYHLDLPLTWAIVLEGKEDLERLKKLAEANDGLNSTPRPYDVWNFAGSHSLFGYEYAGRIPGQLVLQTLYFYTKEGHLVVDPMAGSGTVIDACLVMNRRCLAYDVNPEASKRRPEIRTSDAISALENLKGKADLVFLDPPYYKKREKDYPEDAISSLPRTEYLEYFSKLAKATNEAIAPEGRIALLMSDYTEDDPKQSIFIHHYIRQFEDAGLIVERIILCPLSTEQIHPDIQIKFTDSRKLARLGRYLTIFRRP